MSGRACARASWAPGASRAPARERRPGSTRGPRGAPAPGPRRGACARLPRWLVEGARNQREDSLALLPKAAGHGHPEEYGNSSVSSKNGFAFPLGGRKVGRKGAVFVTREEEAS